jgi:hypothetical protein
MVIVHRETYLFPEGGSWGDHVNLPLITEYLPKGRKFRIVLPDHIQQRLGYGEVPGETADECYKKMQVACQKYRESFQVTRDVRKVIRYQIAYSNAANQAYMAIKCGITFYWAVIHVCQLTSDPSDENGWILCDKEGRISSRDAITDRILLGGGRKPVDRGYDKAGYIHWTPEREQALRDLVEELNGVKKRMIEVFVSIADVEELQRAIDSRTISLTSREVPDA